MRVLKFILRFSRPYRLYLWGLFIGMLFWTMDGTLKPFLLKQLIDTISHQADHNIWLVCSLYFLLQFILVASWRLIDYCITRYSASFRLDVVEYFMKRLYNYPYTFFQNYLTGTLTSKLEDAFKYMPGLIQFIIIGLGNFVLATFISLTLLAQVDLLLAVSMVIWSFLFFTLTFLSLKKSTLLTKGYAKGKSALIGHISDYLGNILSVKIFATKDFELSRHNKFKTDFLTIAHSQGFYFMEFYTLQGALSSLYVVGFVVFLILGYNKGRISPGDFAFVMMTNFNIINTIYNLSHSLRDFVIEWGTVDQAISILDESVDILDRPEAFKLQINKGQIVFNSVKFHYKGVSTLFEDKSITIEGKQKVGLVGYSGSGKSTFVNLILRLYEVTGGQILIDGQNISDCTQDSLRKSISLIPQDPSLFHRSLMENISYGRVEAGEEEVIEAAVKAHAHEFISNLPQGYESLVGEKGVKLSGGQRQRIAIARAILKNAPILILDEATSQLDSLTERYIQESLLTLMQDKTTIVIAHRLSTLLYMDRILVFEKGKIIEDGSHNSLLRKNGIYKSLWDAQIGGFLPDKRKEAVFH